MVILMTTVKEEKQRIDYLLKRDNVTDEELEEIYNEGVTQLRAIVDKSFNAYAVDGVLVPNNLARKVTKKDMVLLKEQYDKLPDDLELPEKQRLDYYLAISQMSLGKLITATLGIALIGITHKVAKVIRQNNKTAVDEEYYYQKKNLQSPKKSKINPIAKDNYVFSKQDNNFVSWTERLWLDHDQILNRIDNSLNSMLRQGMRAQDIAEKLFPGNAKKMRNDNINKALIDATVSAKRLARTEAAAREDELADIFFKENKIKYFDWVTEPGACKKCLAIGALGPYKVGDEASPRIPGSSHPNCRCRRIPTEAEANEKADRLKKALAAGIVSSVGKHDSKESDDDNEEALTEDQKIIKSKMESGEWGTKINPEKQAPHMESTKLEGKSYLYDSEDPQKLLDEYSGKGELNKSIEEENRNKETVKVDHIVGVDYNSGEETSWIRIHHSKERTHVVPIKHNENKE